MAPEIRIELPPPTGTPADAANIQATIDEAIRRWTLVSAAASRTKEPRP
jgi:hypothetical protein